MSLEFIQEIVKEIISDVFTHPLPFNFAGNHSIDVDFKSIHLIQYKALLQGGNNLCGFYSLFNLIQFIKYKKSNDNEKYLRSMNSRWKFWHYYKKTLSKLLTELTIEPPGIKSLLSFGPLERYQFNYLIKQNPLFTSTKDTEINLITFFFGFGLVQCTNKEDVKRNQALIDKFISKSDKDNKEDSLNTKRQILIVLMGIVNHWNIIVIEKKPHNKREYIYSFIDSRNIDVLSIPEDQIEAYSKNMIDYLAKYNRVPSQWWKKCFGQWIKDMSKATNFIIDLIQGELSLFDIYFNDTLQLMLSSFESFNEIDLDDADKDEDVIIKDKAKVFEWMRQEYHPTVANDELIEAIEAFEYHERIKRVALYKKFYHWVIVMEKTINESLIDTIKNKDDIDFALTYKHIILKLKGLLEP